ncbi:hypothetical protein DMENIID0001_013210 [Sergentomyia squamirostris]
MKKFNLLVGLFICLLPDVAISQGSRLVQVIAGTPNPIVVDLLDNLVHLTVSGPSAGQSGCNIPTTCTATCAVNETCMYYNSCWESCDGLLDECLAQPTSIDCYCQAGYRRINGNCVLFNNCPCGENEFYGLVTECEENCGNTQNCPVALYYRCGCMQTFKRKNGVCVDQSICDTTCGPNEVYLLSNICFDTCGRNPYECAGQPNYDMCTCAAGYQRASNGTCLLAIDACPCAANETYRTGNKCSEQCDTEECIGEYNYPQCLCRRGYVRINGTCVDSSNCPTCPGVNEEYTYTSDCREECGQNRTSCSDTRETSYRHCACVDQYKRINGICVPDSECPCPENEQMANLNDCFEQCGSNPYDCAQQQNRRRCYCELNHVRINGSCVPDTVCNQECSEHEIYRYSNDCCESCNSTGIDCTNQMMYKMCTCKVNYKRINGICVPDTNCPCGHDEEYRYGNECLEKCGATQDSCHGHETFKGCFCRKGCARINGVCKKHELCPQRKTETKKGVNTRQVKPATKGK